MEREQGLARNDAGLARGGSASVGDGGMIEQVLMVGDLSGLSPGQRAAYYARVCESLGLNPFTRPFEYITINGRLTLYARRDATDQLRRLHQISVTILSREEIGDLYVVRARATTPDGRIDESTGAVSIAGLQSELLANAMMKAETKAKRRVTLSIVGLGWLDESEVPSVPRARVVRVDDSGEIIDHAPPLAEPTAARSDATSGEPASTESAPQTVPPAQTDGRPSASHGVFASLPGGGAGRPRDPLWRHVEAISHACQKAGLALPDLSADADRATIREWVESRRTELRANATRPGRAA